MAVRPTMQYLVDYVRDLIGDPSSGGVFSDQQIQDRLDLNRLDVYNKTICAADTLTSTGSYAWHDFFAPVGFWETDALLQRIDGPTLTADVSNYLLGNWHFNTALNVDEIVVTGRAYNVYSTCAKLCVSMQNELRTSFNSFTADGLTVQRVGRIADLRSLADDFSAMAWGWGWDDEITAQIRLVRRDIRG